MQDWKTRWVVEIKEGEDGESVIYGPYTEHVARSVARRVRDRLSEWEGREFIMGIWELRRYDVGEIVYDWRIQ